MRRPSKRELFNKIKQGKEFAAEGNVFLIDSDVIAADAIELGYQVANLKRVLCQLLMVS